MSSLLGCPCLPVEHPGKQCRAWKVLGETFPECRGSLVVTLAILQPARLPKTGLSLGMGGEIPSEALVQLNCFGQFLPLFLQAGQRPENLRSPRGSRGLCQPHLVRLDA